MDSDNRAISDFGRQAVLSRENDRQGLMQLINYSLSWTAYPRLLLRLVFRVILLLAAYSLAIWIFKIKHTSLLANAGVFVMLGLALAWTIYDFVYLRTTKLYIDPQGVWLAQGLLPWSTGVSGGRWDELGAASFQQSFLSWACKSYSITVGHRFTTDSALYIRHVKHGDIAVQNINRYLMARARVV